MRFINIKAEVDPVDYKAFAFPYKGVVFDMDGVLVDTEYLEQRYLEEYAIDSGLDVSDGERMALAGSSGADFYGAIVRWWDRAGVPLDIAGARASYAAYVKGEYTDDYQSVMNQGVPETLRALKEMGVKVALASSSGKKTIDKVLSDCKIAQLFDVVVSGEEFRQSKPNPEIYLHTLERLGLCADDCCCVEDSVPGITAGKAAGLTVLAKREERFGFSQDNADEIIDQIPDLLRRAEPAGV